jgi:hypothetical protein
LLKGKFCGAEDRVRKEAVDGVEIVAKWRLQDDLGIREQMLAVSLRCEGGL